MKLFIYALQRNFYVFPGKELRGLSERSMYSQELRGLSPNLHIHVSVSDLYIPTFGQPKSLAET